MRGAVQARVLVVVTCGAVVALEGLALARWQGWWPTAAPAPRAAPPAVAVPAPGLYALAPAAADPHGGLRARVRWVQMQLGRDRRLTPDSASRMLLTKSAAREARLQEVGLGFEDVYGLINAETSWVPRAGSSKDGTPNLGVAQFEPTTARALGLRDPGDVVEAVHAAALHMREAAVWSRQRIAALKLAPAERAARLREGVSVYYNLSSRGRNAWDGTNTAALPRETRSHIRNARLGAQEAAFLETRSQGSRRSRDRPTATALAEP